MESDEENGTRMKYSMNSQLSFRSLIQVSAKNKRKNTSIDRNTILEFSRQISTVLPSVYFWLHFMKDTISKMEISRVVFLAVTETICGEKNVHLTMIASLKNSHSSWLQTNDKNLNPRGKFPASVHSKNFSHDSNLSLYL